MQGKCFLCMLHAVTGKTVLVTQCLTEVNSFRVYSYLSEASGMGAKGLGQEVKEATGITPSLPVEIEAQLMDHPVTSGFLFRSTNIWICPTTAPQKVTQSMLRL